MDVGPFFITLTERWRCRHGDGARLLLLGVNLRWLLRYFWGRPDGAAADGHEILSSGFHIGPFGRRFTSSDRHRSHQTVCSAASSVLHQTVIDQLLSIPEFHK